MSYNHERDEKENKNIYDSLHKKGVLDNIKVRFKKLKMQKTNLLNKIIKIFI